MAEELQPLLDKIRTEGLAKANADAGAIAAKAKADAQAVLEKAQAEAAAIREKAEADAAQLRARSEESLRQAARDVMLKVGRDVQAALERILLADVSAALSDPAALSRCIEGAVSAGIAAGGVVQVPPEAAKAVADTVLASAAAGAAGKDGFRVEAADGVSSGFRVFVENGRVEHDFTAEAVSAALAAAVRPALAAVVFGKRD